MYVSTNFPLPVFRRTPLMRAAFERAATPAVSGRWLDDAYELTADLPGVPDDALGVSVAGRTLTIDVTTDSLTWNERIRLPQTLDPEQVSARYAHGRLTITVGKVAEATPRTIAIDTAPATPALDVGTAEEQSDDQPEEQSGDQSAESETSVTA